MMTKGQVEARISEAIIKFEKDYMGRGPTETKAYIIKDMVLVRLKGGAHPGGGAVGQKPGRGGPDQEDPGAPSGKRQAPT